jgi:hypothetical protein
MPSNLDFDSTKKFRDYILGKTLKQPNGPQSFTNASYTVQNTAETSNKMLGGVEPTNPSLNGNPFTNTYAPENINYIQNINTVQITNSLNLYPSFISNNYNLVGIATGGSTYTNESELFKFAANNIKYNTQGPVYSRIAQNVEKNTTGRARILDALNGNATTAINIITGREPLIEANYKITAESGLSIPGLAVDFLKLVGGVQLPFSQIPGDYLSVPQNPRDNKTQEKERPEAKTQVGKIFQDVTGTLGSMIGINRRPRKDRSPSDLLLEHMGSGQKNRLFDNLSFNTFGPDYTILARSQNTSKLFNGISKGINLVKKITGGSEAPKISGYIGDDRGNSVSNILHDQFDRPTQSSFYLSQFFDSKAAEVFRRNTSISEGGNIAGNLTWISNDRQNKPKYGANNKEWSAESTLYEKSISTNSEYSEFTDNSILSYTQDMLKQSNQVSNAIDQSTRLFKDGNMVMSKGSAIKYIEKFSKEEAGVEYCRVWTKDRSYMNLSDTMRTTTMYRKFEGSVMGGASRVWNLNIAPMSNGKKSFDGSTNIVSGSTYGSNFYAKKYMFSIENLAWKTSNRAGFTVNDLPACERGNNGGRVMWFPPYDLKVTEQNSANWDKNTFVGRPEPIYTYQDSERNGTLSFKVVVDHPSILNLLVREHFKGMSNEEADNYINAFFAGCKDLDFYDLIQTYTTLDREDVTLIQSYLDKGVDPQVIESLTFTSEQVPEEIPGKTEESEEPKKITSRLYFQNDRPQKTTQQGKTAEQFGNIYTEYISKKTQYISELSEELTGSTTTSGLITGTTKNQLHDQQVIFDKVNKTGVEITIDNAKQVIKQAEDGFTALETSYTGYTTFVTELKNNLSGKTVSNEVRVTINASTSEVATDKYNFYLGVRRSYSILVDFLNKISGLDQFDEKIITWYTDEQLAPEADKGVRDIFSINFKDLGYDIEGKFVIEIATEGESSDVPNFNGVGNIDCKKEIKTKTGLKDHAPIAFYCRSAEVQIEYKNKTTKKIEGQTVKVPRLKVSPDKKTVGGRPPNKPTIDVMKRIIMKTLSECHYFKKLEEDSPLQFSSLREKLKYFHPAFHSTTPEGLNSRLTFLLQCLRPGDTIPIINNKLDKTARNTTFGPPPICVLRIGDFYHSKVIIKDINISYDDSPWDMNPEGIGMQPMIASVTLQLSFIGGQGLETPVNKLQNALSSNFFANTEIYDERAEATNTIINGKRAEDFTKEFIEKLTKKPEFELINDLNAGIIDVVDGKYIGRVSDKFMDYTDIISELNDEMKSYLITYKIEYQNKYNEFSKNFIDLYFSHNYRKNNIIKVQTGPTTGDTINLKVLGIPDKGKERSTLMNIFIPKFIDKLKNTNLTEVVFNFYLDYIKDPQWNEASEATLQSFLPDLIKSKLNKISDEGYVDKGLTEKRDKIIEIIDKLNFIMTSESTLLPNGNPLGAHDGQISDAKYKYAKLKNFVSSYEFYSKYYEMVNFFKEATDNIEAIEGTSIAENIIITNDQLVEIVHYLVKDEKSKFLDEYGKSNETYNNIFSDLLPQSSATYFDQIEEFFDTVIKITTTPQYEEFGYDILTAPKFAYEIPIRYEIEEQDELLDDAEGKILNKIFVNKPFLDPSNLNYYKK